MRKVKQYKTYEKFKYTLYQNKEFKRATILILSH